MKAVTPHEAKYSTKASPRFPSLQSSPMYLKFSKTKRIIQNRRHVRERTKKETETKGNLHLIHTLWSGKVKKKNLWKRPKNEQRTMSNEQRNGKE